MYAFRKQRLKVYHQVKVYLWSASRGSRHRDIMIPTLGLVSRYDVTDRNWTYQNVMSIVHFCDTFLRPLDSSVYSWHDIQDVANILVCGRLAASRLADRSFDFMKLPTHSSGNDTNREPGLGDFISQGG